MLDTASLCVTHYITFFYIKDWWKGKIGGNAWDHHTSSIPGEPSDVGMFFCTLLVVLPWLELCCVWLWGIGLLPHRPRPRPLPRPRLLEVVWIFVEETDGGLLLLPELLEFWNFCMAASWSTAYYRICLKFGVCRRDISSMPMLVVKPGNTQLHENFLRKG